MEEMFRGLKTDPVAQSTWESVLRHHESYMRVLEMTKWRLNVAATQLVLHNKSIGLPGIAYPSIKEELKSPVFSFKIDGEVFGLTAAFMCVGFYGAEEDWKNLIMVGCVSNPDLNSESGRGTTHIFCVSEEWHEKVLVRLSARHVEPLKWFPVHKRNIHNMFPPAKRR